MEESISGLKPKRVRKAKAELDSRVFRDGAIYLCRRADYKKPTWFYRVKVPNANGYVSCSTKTTDEPSLDDHADALVYQAAAAPFTTEQVATYEADGATPYAPRPSATCSSSARSIPCTEVFRPAPRRPGASATALSSRMSSAKSPMPIRRRRARRWPPTRRTTSWRKRWSKPGSLSRAIHTHRPCRGVAQALTPSPSGATLRAASTTRRVRSRKPSAQRSAACGTPARVSCRSYEGCSSEAGLTSCGCETPTGQPEALDQL